LRRERPAAIVEIMAHISSKRRCYEIEDPAQLELLASPVRQDILDHLEAMGPSSVTELSRSVGLPADALYYHVRKLLAVGLLVERGTRPGDRRDETVFALPSPAIRLRYDPADADQALSVGKIASAMLRSSDRDFQAGLRSEKAVAEGRGRNLWSARVKGWLDAGQLREVNELLNRLHSVFHAAGPGDDRTLCALTWSMAPVAAQPVRRPMKER
jgi:DNA-binding transcriptional ArsR family regulator